MADINTFVNEEEYDKGIKIFYSRSTELEVVLKWMKAEMPDIITRSNISNEPFAVLAVGTGDGNPYDDELLTILSKLNMKVHYTVVEPRADTIDVFKNRVESKYQNTQFEWIQTTFENYQDSEWLKYPRKFNLINFFHSLYYFVTSLETLGARLRPCYTDMLKDGGAMISFLSNQSENKVFYPETTDVDFFDLPDIAGKLSRREGWKHENYNRYSHVDLTECFDETSETGGHLLDFLTHTSNTRQKLDKDQLNKVMEHLEKQCELLEDGRKVATRRNMDITVIYKN